MTISVLLVEDDATDREVVRRFLADACSDRFDVAYAGTVEEADRILQGRAFDVVLLDLELPDSHGRSTIEHVVELVPQTPVVVVTDADHLSFAADFARAGAQDYLPKGRISRDGLHHAIVNAIERHRIRQGLLDSAHHYREFANQASHDLKAPMRRVHQLLGFLRDDCVGALDEASLRHLERIDEQATHMSELIESLLGFACAGNSALHFDDVDLRDVLESALESLRQSIDSTDARISYGELGSVCGDAIWLARLFQNLIENAIRYSGDGRPEIDVSAVRGRETCTVFVRDRGVGLNAEDVGRLFKPFARVGGRAVGDGSGIGLSVCRTVVERHGGCIHVESPGPGRGVTVSFTLPLHRRVEPAIETDLEVGALPPLVPSRDLAASGNGAGGRRAIEARRRELGVDGDFESGDSESTERDLDPTRSERRRSLDPIPPDPEGPLR